MTSAGLTGSEIASYYRQRFPELRQVSTSELRGPCPLHGGKGPNFSVNLKTGQWFCHSRCQRGGDIFSLEQELFSCDFVKALDTVGAVIGRDLTRNEEEHHHCWGAPVTYEYTDTDGIPLYQVRRQDCEGCTDKKVWQQKPDGGENVIGVQRVPYRLTKVVSANTVYVVEGEPKVHALEQYGLTATCNAGGAGKWQPEFNGYLRDKTIVILPDNDAPGKRHALSIARSLLGAATVYILELPGLPPKGDIVNWQQAGHTQSEFEALVAQLQPETVESLAAHEIEWGLVPVSTVEAVSPKPNGPGPMAPEAFYGIAGEFVKLVEPHSEADPASLAISLLIACGNYLSRTTYYLVDGSKHYPNEFAVIVGDSAKGRKGTSWNRAKQVLQKTDPDYYKTRCTSGLSSGEGVIWAVRDPIMKQEPVKKNGRTEDYQEVMVDAGVEDKRLLVIEGEFVRCLQAMKREGNTLSAVARECWDSGNLNTLTKNNAATATDAHVSIVAHITVEELLRHLSATDSANGFANRFLWIYARRSKCLPFGGDLTDEALDPIAAHVQKAADFAASCGPMRFDAEAAAHWCDVYPQLSEGGKGLAGVITSRNEAHAVRLAALYALLDLSPVIKLAHLRAALAVVDYSTRSVQFIFAGKLGDDTADTILQVLTATGEDGMSRNDLYNHFGKNKSSGEIGRALGILKKDGLAFMREESTGGRKAERWYVVREKGAKSGAQMELFT